MDTEAIANGFGGGSLYSNPNQPETDDSSLSINSTGSSPAAEISYFVRNGNLYRRVVLLRNPLPLAGQDIESQPVSFRDFDLLFGDHDPSDTTVPGVHKHLFQRNGGARTNDYWQYFDYAAHAPPGAATGGNLWAQLLGVAALNNENTTVGALTEALGNPIYRWGFDPFSGRSREHDNLTDRRFIGHYLHGETSATNFNFPQSVCVEEGSAEPDETAPNQNVAILGNGNPYDITGVPIDLDTDDDLVDQFDEAGVNGADSSGRGGPRAMEDLLLANVHEFKIEIWDERFGDFVAPAYGNRTPTANEVVGDYHFSRAINTVVGPWGAIPSTPRDRVFDSWHPNVAIDFDGDSTVELYERSPPFIAYEFYPPRQSDAPPGPSSNFMPSPSANNRGYWMPNMSYAVDDIVFGVDAVHATGGWDIDGNGIFDWMTDDVPNQAFQIAYRCIAESTGTGSGNSDVGPPGFSETAGRRITDNEVIWESFDNRRPLKAVRLTIRYISQKANEPRQLTLVLPLTE